MNPQYLFKNENEDDNKDNIFPRLGFSCPICFAHFSTLEERDVHYHNELLSLCNQDMKEITVAPRFTHTIPTYYACPTDSTFVTQMLLPPRDEVKPFDLGQFSMVVPQRVTMDLLSLVRDAEPRSYQMDVGGDVSLELKLGLPIPEAVDTTLSLALPGFKKESNKKPRLDLNLKI